MKAQTNDKSHASAILVKIVKYTVPVAVSVALVVWLFHKVDFNRVMGIVKSGVDYRYIIAMMLFTVLAMVIRGVRWGIQLRAVGIPRIPAVAESVSIFGAYALNLVFPFLGEAWRCVYMSRRTGWKLSTIVGTDLGDRGSDGVMILLIIALTLGVASGPMMRFMDHYSFGESLMHAMRDGYFWVCTAVLLGLVAALLYLCRRTRFVQNIEESCLNMWNGFKVLLHMKGTGMYLLLTLGIWVCYYLETYSCFYAFPFTRALIETPGTCRGLLPGLVVFVFGSCSMIVPSNGGLGPWNVAVMFALSLYGISDTDGTAYSLVCWSFQAITYIALGIFSAIYIQVRYHKSTITTKMTKT